MYRFNTNGLILDNDSRRRLQKIISEIDDIECQRQDRLAEIEDMTARIEEICEEFLNDTEDLRASVTEGMQELHEAASAAHELRSEPEDDEDEDEDEDSTPQEWMDFSAYPENFFGELEATCEVHDQEPRSETSSCPVDVE